MPGRRDARICNPTFLDIEVRYRKFIHVQSFLFPHSAHQDEAIVFCRTAPGIQEANPALLRHHHCSPCRTERLTSLPSRVTGQSALPMPLSPCRSVQTMNPKPMMIRWICCISASATCSEYPGAVSNVPCCLRLACCEWIPRSQWLCLAHSDKEVGRLRIDRLCRSSQAASSLAHQARKTCCKPSRLL